MVSQRQDGVDVRGADGNLYKVAQGESQEQPDKAGAAAKAKSGKRPDKKQRGVVTDHASSRTFVNPGGDAT
jgi:hypothetical protein